MPGTQTRRKRKLGQYLQQLRARSGVSHEAVAELLRKSQATISKIENGYIQCSFSELGAMLAFYGAAENERHEAQGRWDDAKHDSVRIQVSSAHPSKYRAFVRAEADAETVRTLSPLVMPGLLQTVDYATAIHATARHFGDQAVSERAVESRRNRQERLGGTDPLKLHALIDEAVVRRVVGGPAVMSRQLWHVLAMIERQNVTVQVMRFISGAYGTSSGPMTILGFSDADDLDAVYLEYPGGGEWVENERDVQAFAATFTDVACQAMTPEESAALIRIQAEGLGDDGRADRMA